jgi:1,4-alpha-glucan branching enzyme
MPDIPMGASLTADGATFRIWAPRAETVSVVLDAGETALVKDAASGHWTGSVAGVRAGDGYRFRISGPTGAGLKRDPRARDIGFAGPPAAPCIVVDPDAYPWHDAGFRTPDFSDLAVYQLHVGRFYARDAAGADLRIGRVAKLLDALDRVEDGATLALTVVRGTEERAVAVSFGPAAEGGEDGTA